MTTIDELFRKFKELHEKKHADKEKAGMGFICCNTANNPATTQSSIRTHTRN